MTSLILLGIDVIQAGHVSCAIFAIKMTTLEDFLHLKYFFYPQMFVETKTSNFLDADKLSLRQYL